jgi:LysR family hydrogen peroxide-inducible transcriptional activator
MATPHHPPHPFTLRQLQYAVAVGESLSFRKAAGRCGVSQPSLSAQLAQLEDVLGVRLFERDRRRVLVTSAGRALLAQARRVLLDADDLLETARRAGDPLAGALRIGVIPTVSPYLLPAIAPAIRSAFPALSLTWVEERTGALVRSLHAGELDAALLAAEAELGDVEQAVLARDAFLLATPRDHPLGAPRAPATPADLRDGNVLLLEDGHCLREQALAVCSRGRARELEFRATSLSTLAQMVAGGAGVTLLPELAAETEGRRAALRLRPFADPAPHRTIALVWRRTSPAAEGLRRLAAAIRDAYPRPPARGARAGRASR